jgi:hypothetical protein
MSQRFLELSRVYLADLLVGISSRVWLYVGLVDPGCADKPRGFLEGLARVRCLPGRGEIAQALRRPRRRQQRHRTPAAGRNAICIHEQPLFLGLPSPQLTS